MERGIVVTPGSVPSITTAIANVKRIKYFKNAIKSNSKWHISIGHATVMATVTFFHRAVGDKGEAECGHFDWSAEYMFEV